MAEVIECLVTRRPRRSTAGNRMEAALAEMVLDNSNKDVDDDVEFVNDKVEEDVFESDFASTDEEEANQEDLDAGEKAIHEEEKSTRKAARTRFEKHTAAAHAKHKATFNPQVIAPPVIKPKPVVKSVEARNEFASTSGDVITSPRRAGQKRKSQRMHTVRNTTETVSRLKETEEKRASAPKKYKPTTRIYSQSELIQWALDNEEGNIKEHKNYLKNEEEKRKKARVIKMPAVEGPLLRWVSKIEEEKFKVQVDVTPPAPPPPPPQPANPLSFSPYTNYYGAYSYYANYLSQLINTTAAAGNNATTATTTTTAAAAVGNTVTTTPTTTTTTPQTTVPSSDYPETENKITAQAASPTPTASSVPPVAQPTASTSTSALTTITQPTVQTMSFTSTPMPATPVTQPTNQAFSTFRINAPTTSTVPTYPTFNYYTPTSTGTTTSASTFPTMYPQPTATVSIPTQPAQRQYVEEERTEKVTKNYVVHELGQREGIGKPPWKEMMKSMFGDHVKWDEVRVLSGKGRPMSRVKQRCPITGQIAPYLDPHTGVPFSNVEAYKILSEVLDHGYIWSPELGCYLSRDEDMQDVG